MSAEQLIDVLHFETAVMHASVVGIPRLSDQHGMVVHWSRAGIEAQEGSYHFFFITRHAKIVGVDQPESVAEPLAGDCVIGSAQPKVTQAHYEPRRALGA